MSAVPTRRDRGPAAPASGVAMDEPAPRRPWRRGRAAVGAGALLLAGYAAWALLPRGVAVGAADLRIATAQRGLLRDDLVVRATVAPLHTVLLDAPESGRVEDIFVTDGALVRKGDLLFRLSNPQLRLELVAREADRAQQIANLALLRVAVEEAETAHQRRLLDLGVELAQAERLHRRYAELAAQGYVSQMALETAHDRLDQQRQAVESEQRRSAVELAIKRDGVAQMQRAIARLDAGLKVVNASIDGLAARAAIDGRLTNFRLELGEMVEQNQKIGRIDGPDRFKLTADVDEYFLGRVAVDKQGVATANARDYPITVTRVFPQIKDGRFAVDLNFVRDEPEGMSPGQSVVARVTLGEQHEALYVPNDAFLAETGGAWMFVLDAGGTRAERRAIRVGRRTPTQVEVLSGLTAGERVVVSSYARFKDATALRLVDERG